MLKVILGAVSLLPTIYVVALVGSLNSPSSYQWLLERRYLVMILVAALGVSYMTHALISSRVPNTKRLHWLITLAFFNFIVFPVYFMRFVWRRPDEAAA